MICSSTGYEQKLIRFNYSNYIKIAVLRTSFEQNIQFTVIMLYTTTSTAVVKVYVGEIRILFIILVNVQK